MSGRETNPAAPPGDPSARPRGAWRVPIWAVLAFGFGGLVAAAVGAVLWVSLDIAEKNTSELLRQTAVDEIQAIVGNLTHHLSPARDLVEFAAAQIEAGAVAPDDDARLSDLLLGTLAAAPQVTGIAFVREDLYAVRAGREGGSHGAAAGSWIDRPEVRLAIREGPTLTGFIWGGPVFFETLGTTFLAPRRPVRIGGEFRGIVVAVVAITETSAFLRRSVGTLGGVSFVLSGRDQVYAHPALAPSDPAAARPILGVDHPLPDRTEVGDPVLAAIWSEPLDDLSGILGGSPVKGRVINAGNGLHLVLYREIADYGSPPWIVGVHFRLEDVNRPVQRILFAGALGLGILVIAVGVALLLGHSIARPARRLAAAAEAVRALEPERVGPLPGSFLRELDSAATAFNSMMTALRRFATYVPRSLVLLLMQRGETELVSDERQLTVLFTDIVGFTAIAQRLTAPQLAAFLNRHFALLAACIEAEGGTLDKYIGDSVMAFWGAPEPQPDHAARACRAARRIAAALQADNARRRGKGLRPVRLRIGIHSGSAIAGNIGAPGRINYTLIGDTVNTAQRLEQFGKTVDSGVGDVVTLVSGATAAQVVAAEVAALALRPLGAHGLRGRDDTTEVYALG